KPVSFKSLTPVAQKIRNDKPLNGQFKDVASSLSNASKKDLMEKPAASNNARLIIEEDSNSILLKPLIDHTAVATIKHLQKNKKITALEKIREQVAIENKLNGNAVKNLNEEELYVAWGLYIEELRKKNNHSGVSNFKSAHLKIIDDNCIEIITDNNIQQKFVETERAALIEHLQAYFNNRYLTYKVIIVENKNQDKVADEHLSTKEQYLRIIEEYPLVKQLKDKLGLQLDY
ncbi:MAG: hypothetical protein ABJA90_12280, partial [Ginsengibacter sp.]